MEHISRDDYDDEKGQKPNHDSLPSRFCDLNTQKLRVGYFHQQRSKQMTYLILAISMQNAKQIVKQSRTEDNREADKIAKAFRSEGYRSQIRVEVGA